DKLFSELALEMADWLCTLQIGLDPKNLHWQGGFAGWQNGRVTPQEPTNETALLALGLAQACSAARQMGGNERFGRYRGSVERGLQFVIVLQYNSANSRHFAEWYQPQLFGAFFASPQDGNTRLDYAQHAVCAMCQYLDQVAETSLKKR